MHEPIVKCRACRGEGICAGPLGPFACAACFGTGLRAVTVTKSCACGACYDARAWERLPFVGEMEDGSDVLELRNCRACGSTIAVAADAADDERRVA